MEIWPINKMTDVFQGYQLEFLPVTVTGIPSMHICLDFIPELLHQQDIEKQVCPVFLWPEISPFLFVFVSLARVWLIYIPDPLQIAGPPLIGGRVRSDRALQVQKREGGPQTWSLGRQRWNLAGTVRAHEFNVKFSQKNTVWAVQTLGPFFMALWPQGLEVAKYQLYTLISGGGGGSTVPNFSPGA